MSTETSTALLTDALDRVREVAHQAADGLTPDQLAHRVDGTANSIAWLVWHLTRVQDDHVAELAGVEQTWTGQGWAEKFDLPFDDSATGYGHTSDDVDAVGGRTADLLLGYHDAVHRASTEYVRTLTDEDFGRVVDQRWDPPVTLSVRLVSVLSDDLQHAGQAAFVRGLLG
ncbi:mycothiol transferase [Umezawaea tangerina]|uniref:Uncharacterized protein DUF664 n=1 Tax=Umezawaea tangerina TaxID=84725 RepID=A0A2T0SVD5_9PSEU|nr:DUF664 domain-containing protein [Umezawaea tangerina]PRY37379.1 uncharacterized protein DUF664 [Umezawaea tangerina]